MTRSRRNALNRGGVIALGLIALGFAAFWPISWFANNHNRTIFGAIEWCRRHPNITTRLANMFAFLVVALGLYLFAKVWQAETRLHEESNPIHRYQE